MAEHLLCVINAKDATSMMPTDQTHVGMSGNARELDNLLEWYSTSISPDDRGKSERYFESLKIASHKHQICGGFAPAAPADCRWNYVTISRA